MKTIFNLIFPALLMGVLVLSGCSLEVINPALPPVTFQTKIPAVANNQAFGVEVIQSKDSGYVVFGSTNTVSSNYDFYVLKFNAKGEQKWTKSLGSGGNDFAYSGIQTSDGGYALTGGSDSKLYVLKLDQNGNQQWAYTGPNYAVGVSMVVNSDGSLTIGGQQYDVSGNPAGMVIIKLSSGGMLVWTRTIFTAAAEWLFQMVAGPSGTYAVAGYAKPFSTSDGLLLFLDANGNETARKTFPGSFDGNDFFKGIAHTSDGGYVLSGRTDVSATNADYRLIKTDATGNQLWQQTWGDTEGNEAVRVVENKDLSFTVLGNTVINSFLTPSLTKFTATGQQGWSKNFDVGSLYDLGLSIKSCLDKGFVFTGNSYLSNGSEVFLIKTNAEGDI